MMKRNDYLEFNEDLKALKKSIEKVKKLDWNNENKTNKRKVKNTVERNAA